MAVKNRSKRSPVRQTPSRNNIVRPPSAGSAPAMFSPIPISDPPLGLPPGYDIVPRAFGGNGMSKLGSWLMFAATVGTVSLAATTLLGAGAPKVKVDSGKLEGKSDGT